MINELINDVLNWFIPNFYTKLEFLILLSILLFTIKICCLKGRSKINLVINIPENIFVCIYFFISFIICMIYLPVLLVIAFSLPCLFIPLVELMTKFPLFHSIVSFMFCHCFVWVVIIIFECISLLIYFESDSALFIDLELFWFVTAFFATLCVV